SARLLRAVREGADVVAAEEALVPAARVPRVAGAVGAVREDDDVGAGPAAREDLIVVGATPRIAADRRVDVVRATFAEPGVQYFGAEAVGGPVPVVVGRVALQSRRGRPL